MSKVEGHFEITNAALNLLKQEMPDNALLSGVPTVDGRLDRGDTMHFVKGSVVMAASKTENPAWGAVYRDLRDVWSGGHWEDSAQKHHFMRKFSGQNSRSAYEAAVAWIQGEATNAAKKLYANLKSGRGGNMFLGAASDHLGNAVHALQDSFSSSHVQRICPPKVNPGKYSGPGEIAKVYVYEGHEKDNHSDHDKKWDNNGKGFSKTGEHAVTATKELIKKVVLAVLAAGQSLAGWPLFQDTWLKASPMLDRYHELRNKQLLNRYIHIARTNRGTFTIIKKRQLAEAVFRDLSQDPINLKEVFLAFDEAHWADSDDLAELYVHKVQQVGGPALETLKKNKSVVQLLIKCMDEGWTTSGEQKCIDWLKSL